MSENQNNQDEVMNHDYDGIKEFDNPLPNWWLITFYGTIIFAFIYFIHYEFGGGPTLKQELSVAMKDVEAAKAANAASAPAETEESLTSQMAAAGAIENGKQVFAAKCAACHGENLQGLIGPNLTDNYWIHGKGTRKDIVAVIRTGVADKGMPAWETLLKPEELVAVAGYVYSKKGSNPANAKAPQGELVQ